MGEVVVLTLHHESKSSRKLLRAPIAGPTCE